MKLEWGGEKVAVGFRLQEDGADTRTDTSFCLLYWTVKNHLGERKSPAVHVAGESDVV